MYRSYESFIHLIKNILREARLCYCYNYETVTSLRLLSQRLRAFWKLIVLNICLRWKGLLRGPNKSKRTYLSLDKHQERVRHIGTLQKISENDPTRKLVTSAPRLSFWRVWFRHNPPSGYDEDFVNAVEEDCHCLICHLPLKEPVLTRCGHRFCEQCLEEHNRRYGFKTTAGCSNAG